MPISHRVAASVAFCAAIMSSAWAQPATVTANGITLKSVSVDLPFGTKTFSGGANANAINGNCLTCHSAEMVLTQPALTRAQWQAEVTKMRATYKAPIADADVPAIVDYLAVK
jgi:cytochrome c553